ncbi:unnamed protein product [Citrullus colocynthis]|uniref:Uncharacterized protein n=1 Tax=Citrullus colocynthis TaxID=252529 RepID=A0ABP0ZA29_9ROSI
MSTVLETIGNGKSLSFESQLKSAILCNGCPVEFSEAHIVISVHPILQDLIMGQTLGAFQFSLQIELISGPGMPLSSSLSSHAHQLFVEMSARDADSSYDLCLLRFLG